jgi:PAS domain S-box-containing protein
MRLKAKFFILILTVATGVIGLESINLYFHRRQHNLTQSIQTDRQIYFKFIQAKNYQNLILIESLKLMGMKPIQNQAAITANLDRWNDGLFQTVLQAKQLANDSTNLNNLSNNLNNNLNNANQHASFNQAVINFNEAVERYLTNLTLEASRKPAAIPQSGSRSLPPLSRGEIAPQNELIQQSQFLTDLLDQAISFQLLKLQENQAISQRIARWSFSLNIISLTVGSTVAILMAWLFAKQVANPILKLKNVALKIGQGEWETYLDINTEDEIGILAKAFNQIVEKFKQTNESKQYVDKIIRNINESLIVLDDKYQIKDFNFSTLLLLGYEEEELIGTSIEKLFLDPQACKEILGIDDTIANSFLGTKETVLVAKDGRQIPVSFSASIMWDEQDKVEGIVCLVQDISAHKQAIESLRRQALMFETIHDGILLTDLDGYIIDCNPAAERIFGYSKIKMVGQMTGMLRYPPPPLGQDGDRAQYLTQQIMHGVLSRGRWTGEFRFIRGDGSWGICETIVVPLRDHSNKLIATIGVNRDVSERKQAEDALRKSEERLESILNSLNDIVWSMEINRQEILYLNPAIAKVYGRSVGEFFAQPSLWFDAIHPEDRPRVMDFSAEMFANGERDIEYRIVRPDGEVRWLHDRGKLTGDREKNFLRFEGIATDITEQKHAQKLLAEAHAQLEQRVEERTAELMENNEILLTEIRERVAAEKALRESENKFKQLARQETLVNQLTEQIRNSLDLSTILKTTVEQIRTVLSLDRCVFIWYRQQDCPQENQWIWQVVAEAKHRCLPSILGEYPAQPAEFIAQKIKNLEIIREDNLATATDINLKKIYQDWHYQSILALPIITHTGQIGVISCGNFRRIKPWSDADVALLQAITNQLAIALFQAELYSQAQTAAQVAHERAEELKETLEQLQKTQAQLIQSEKMSSLGQLVAGVAHEINNPVNFISGNINFVQDYTRDLLKLLGLYQKKYSVSDAEILAAIEEYDLDFIRDDLPKLLSSMQVGANRIREIVLSLRNFSRLDEANYKLVNLHDGIENTLMILQHRLYPEELSNSYQPNGAKIKVTKDYGNLPKIECFASLLNQVFMNILNNAIDALESSPMMSEHPLITHDKKWLPNGAIATINSADQTDGFTSNINRDFASSHCHLNQDNTEVNSGLNSGLNSGKTPTIHICTEVKTGDRVVIRIRDNGPGMPDSIRQRIFDPFFTTKPVGSGTGLGLSISYQIIVQRHHGDLYCISLPGQGSEFIIELPIHQ